jgi:hypothetical protein
MTFLCLKRLGIEPVLYFHLALYRESIDSIKKILSLRNSTLKSVRMDHVSGGGCSDYVSRDKVELRFKVLYTP